MSWTRRQGGETLSSLVVLVAIASRLGSTLLKCAICKGSSMSRPESQKIWTEHEKEQIGEEGYHEMGKKGGLSTSDKSGGERAAEEGIKIDESKYKTKNR
ncbi:hypothetical protein C1H46_042851 [Malus baccata]|uniref:Uncharacterized protein n=1 Tax=Malus baccata TaxID=106549 RepID=A0A540KBL4_MALBA|nr:hypothetical protein C1H46_042851 [Malus baccata]